jgi:hypothetical protein
MNTDELTVIGQNESSVISESPESSIEVTGSTQNGKVRQWFKKLFCCRNKKKSSSFRKIQGALIFTQTQLDTLRNMNSDESSEQKLETVYISFYTEGPVNTRDQTYQALTQLNLQGLSIFKVSLSRKGQSRTIILNLAGNSQNEEIHTGNMRNNEEANHEVMNDLDMQNLLVPQTKLPENMNCITKLYKKIIDWPHWYMVGFFFLSLILCFRIFLTNLATLGNRYYHYTNKIDMQSGIRILLAILQDSINFFIMLKYILKVI